MKISEVLRKKEENYTILKYDEKFLTHKKQKILEIKKLLGINNNKITSEEDFLKIRSLALDEGGFLNTENRLYFYEIILDYLQEKFNYNEYYKQDEDLSITPCKFINEITNDYERTNARVILSKEIGTQQLESEFNHIIEKIKIFTMELYNNNQKFSRYFDYYQGYQQLSLMILLLNIENEISQTTITDEVDKRSLSLIQKITETHFFHFVHKKYKIPFDEILYILNDLIYELDDKVRANMQLISNSQPTYALTWIITWLSLKNSDLFLQFRIFDYLISSHSMSILFLCAVIIIEELKEKVFDKKIMISDKEKFNEVNQETQFENLDLSRLEFDNIIKKTEKALQKVDIEKLIRKNKRNVTLIINNQMKNKRWMLINFKWIFPIMVLFLVLFIGYYFKSFASNY